MTGPWGLLPLAVPALVYVAMRLGAIAYPERASHRAVSGVLLALGLVVLVVRLLGAVGALGPGPLAVALLASVVALAFTQRQRAFTLPLRGALDRDAWPIVVVALASSVAAVVAAYWLPIWQWDSLGYHLPYVNFALGEGGLDGVPRDIPYLATYPHDVEFLMIALRAMLPDDRLVDLAQVPLGVAGAVVTAGIARLLGAERSHALVAGAAWLLVPAVFLQLPTNYVDVGAAAFLLAAIYFALLPPSPRSLALAGVALGLYLGTKPNAPMGTAVLGAVLAFRGLRARQFAATGAMVALLLLFGAESYLTNLWRHHNPIWPVAIDVGPIHLPGNRPMSELLESGAAAPRTHGSLPVRLLRSWTSLDGLPAFDMRKGGFGLLFLVSLPFAAMTLWERRKELVLWAAVGATLASPDPAVARYVFAFPALVFALTAARLARLSPRARTPLLAVATTVAAIQIGCVWSGLTGEGPPLGAYAAMSEGERARAVGADGEPTPFIEARRRVRDDETFAFDHSADLPYLVWESDLRYRAVWIPEEVPPEAIGEFFEQHGVRVFLAGDDAPAGVWVRRNPERVTRLFPCKSVPCAVYVRL